MGQPAALATATSGGSTRTEALIKAAHLVLDNCGLRMVPAKVARLVRDYERSVAANGFSFFAFLANAVQLTEQQRHRALANPDVARAISYADPTGESAVNNVMKGR